MRRTRQRSATLDQRPNERDKRQAVRKHEAGGAMGRECQVMAAYLEARVVVLRRGLRATTHYSVRAPPTISAFGIGLFLWIRLVFRPV
jgi:hypothetical protein